MSNCCTDQLLAVIGINCRNLEVLDAEEDSEMMTTDHGLSFLTNCTKLTTVILNDAGDEYDYEDRYFGITGKGVANLLISLPRLTLLMCEPYLLREAIKFVHSINVNSLTYKLTYLHTRFPDRDFLMSATSLNPDIKELGKKMSNFHTGAGARILIYPKIYILNMVIFTKFTFLKSHF